MQVKIEVLPWLSELLSGSIARKVVLEETVPEGESLRALLGRLQENHGRFGRLVFDPERQQLTGHAEIAINGALYDQAGGLDAPLQEGDTVTFLPGIAGG
ncbi:MAG: MoaD/ThiS family protein [Chloroflexi bacterium]|nr:MoaD/ThiS family protein [Chloroflexota bacterium]